MRYALVNPQDGINRLASDVVPTVQTKAGWRWLPCPVVAKPAYDPATEVIEGPTYTVGETEVTEAWTKRNKTAEEISTEKDSVVNSVMHLQLLVAHDMENRMRAQEGLGSVTLNQYKAALKARL